MHLDPPARRTPEDPTGDLPVDPRHRPVVLAVSGRRPSSWPRYSAGSATAQIAVLLVAVLCLTLVGAWVGWRFAGPDAATAVADAPPVPQGDRFTTGSGTPPLDGSGGSAPAADQPAVPPADGATLVASKPVKVVLMRPAAATSSMSSGNASAATTAGPAAASAAGPAGPPSGDPAAAVAAADPMTPGPPTTHPATTPPTAAHPTSTPPTAAPRTSTPPTTAQPTSTPPTAAPRTTAPGPATRAVDSGSHRRGPDGTASQGGVHAMGGQHHAVAPPPPAHRSRATDDDSPRARPAQEDRDEDHNGRRTDADVPCRPTRCT